MTPYGKSILFGEKKPEGNTNISGVFDQVLRGKLGKQSIVMLLEKHADNSISGTYFYSKYRKAIDLYGRVNGKQIELDERDPDGEIVARLKLLLDGNRLKGEWQQDGRALPLSIDVRAP